MSATLDSAEQEVEVIGTGATGSFGVTLFSMPGEIVTTGLWPAVAENTLSVRIDASEPGCLVAEDVPTGIFGAGADLANALADLGIALREHMDVLEGDEEHLSVGLARQLAYLRERIPADG